MPSSEPSSLNDHAERLARVHLRELIQDPQRNEQLRHRVGPLLVDLSRQALDGAALQALGEALEATGWQQVRDAMFAGEAINRSEGRAVLHTALRASGSRLPSPAPAEIRHEIEQTLQKIERLVTALHAGEGASYGLPTTVTDVVHIGIGGSDLGPRLAVHALYRYRRPHTRVHFLTNVDGQTVHDLLAGLDPRRSLVIIASKSFNTQETQLNANALRTWIARAYDGDDRKVARHFLAVTARPEAALAWGVPEAHIYPMWDYVGGRTSLWSAVGLVTALAMGMEHFRALLAGAARMDDHFRSTEWSQNLPVLLAMVDHWNRNLKGYGSRAVLAYADLLRDFTPYLQQLEMESLGKSTGHDGEPLAGQTGPVVWGGVGTNAQHAYFQALHQGTDIVPVEFIALIRPDHPLHANHDALLSNVLGQAATLALGRSREQALAEPARLPEGLSAEALAAQRELPGNRPSTIILLDELTPQTLGSLIALYEHKVFVLGHWWGLNAYDQWGVEPGKALARQIAAVLDAEATDLEGFDPATRALIQDIQDRREG
ncbi:glucose-6-phosphate isomerase [Frateuria aurantia]